MTYLCVLFTGIFVGALYAVSRVKAPAPPISALVGLAGMVIAGHALSAL